MLGGLFFLLWSWYNQRWPFAAAMSGADS